MKGEFISGFDVAQTYRQFLDFLENQQHAGLSYDGIISDLFFPVGDGGLSGKVIKECTRLLKVDAMESGPVKTTAEAWQRGIALPPAGVSAVMRAKKYKIPIVLITARYHHSFAANPVDQFCFEKGIGMFDKSPDPPSGFTEEQRNAERGPKDWFEAFMAIAYLSQHPKRMSRAESPYALFANARYHMKRGDFDQEINDYDKRHPGLKEAMDTYCKGMWKPKK